MIISKHEHNELVTPTIQMTKNITFDALSGVLNPLTAKLFNWNCHQLEVVSR